jgi:serine/threonine-protein kinase
MVLAINAVVARNEAVVARNEADQRRVQAEDLLGFMVGDLRTSLTPLGRLDLLEDVGDRAMEYFATVELDILTDGELLRQAQVLTQLGEIRFEQLKYEEALASFTEAYNRSDALAMKNGDDGDRLFNRGQAEFWVGYVHLRNGTLQDAQEWMIRYRDTSLELVELDPDRDEWKREVGYAYHNLAVLAQQRGELGAAQEGYSLYLEVLLTLEANDEGAVLQIEIADAISWLGEIAREEGELAITLEYYQQSKVILENLLERDTSDTRVQDYLGLALWREARIDAMTGDLNHALQLVDASIQLYAGLVETDPSNSNFLGYIARAYLLKANIFYSRGRGDEAREFAEMSLAGVEELFANGTIDFYLYEILAGSHLVMVRVAQDRAEIDTALAHSSQALDAMLEIQKANRLDNDRIFVLSMTYLNRAALFAASGNNEAQAEQMQKLEELLHEEIKSNKSVGVLDPWVRFLLLTGRSEEAKVISDELIAHRYQPLIPW